jgi:hypothetical protein
MLGAFGKFWRGRGRRRGWAKRKPGWMKRKPEWAKPWAKPRPEWAKPWARPDFEPGAEEPLDVPEFSMDGYEGFGKWKRWRRGRWGKRKAERWYKRRPGICPPGCVPASAPVKPPPPPTMQGYERPGYLAGFELWQ